jgi:hypothetical protein
LREILILTGCSDQGLSSEPAELLILQHYHQITTSVISMMEACAHDLRNPRKYMIIDGAHTSRILKSRGCSRQSPWSDVVSAAALHDPFVGLAGAGGAGTG